MEETQAQASPRGSSALVHVTVSSLTPKLSVAWEEGVFSAKGSSEASQFCPTGTGQAPGSAEPAEVRVPRRTGLRYPWDGPGVEGTEFWV